MATVLLIDDNPVERRVMRMTLDMDGHRVAEASTADEAIDIVAKHPVELIFLAIADGEARSELVARIHATPGREHTPIVSVLEGDDERGPVESFMAGAIDLLIRPFGANDVRETIARATSEEADRRRVLVGWQLDAFETAQRLQEQARSAPQI